jgi:hypothetical protein
MSLLKTDVASYKGVKYQILPKNNIVWKFSANLEFNGRFQNLAMMIGSWTASFFLQVNNCYSRLGKSGFSEKKQ